MTKPISLLFGVHAHQPVGNFDFVMEEAHVRCYRMFLQTLERYPDFRFSVHFSGWLLDWLQERYPEDMERLAMMTRRGQVEWFGSGDCEPVLASIPHRDRVSQINTLSDKIERRFGQRPKGAWLTERVWESAVVPSLADTGIEYVAVDDYHFLCAGEPAGRLDSYFTTEEDGRKLDLFPISEQARYRLPFSPAEAAVVWLEHLAREGHRAAVYFDDIEKFGIWPETYHWVYEQGWLTRFIEGVLASPLIKTATYAEFHASQTTRGIVYLPTTSYIEMNEWTLPAPAARTYHALVEQEKQAGHFEQRKAFLRGGMWRNFFMRFPESNWMHKRMLDVSARLAALPPKKRTAGMQEQLHRAQANDAYWHGLFGGLYLPHLRRAIWHNLLALEANLDGVAPPLTIERHDLDCDGHDEVFLRGGGLLAVVRADGDAALVEFSSHPLAHNFGDTLRRHDEGYHDKLHVAHGDQAQHDGIASAHDRVAFRHEISPADAEPDARPRGMFIDCWYPAEGAPRPVNGYVETEAGDFSAPLGAGTISKAYTMDGERLVVRYRSNGAVGRIEIRLNIAMPSCDGYLGRYLLENGDVPCGFGDRLQLSGMRRLTLDDGVLGGSIRVALDQALAMTARAHRTVSQSEAGFEKIMQAADVAFSWPLDGTPRELAITLEARPHPA
ncbi:MAG TPA: alpha-amylase/4-alpha-glucanotransferase domain-containing protein [Rhodocyclaceae bacterium]|nr:alpha-amylase/4-alpha-glucanotransferase domain-containing protein [Rhodocyclaceae bacterium]